MSISEKQTIRIALDAMGGDFAPANEVDGAVLFYDQFSSKYDLEIVFTGEEAKIKAALEKHSGSGMKYSIVPTDSVVTMHDEPASVLKTKKNSSLYKGVEMLRDGKVEAFASAGNTGAVLSVSTVLLGRIKGVSRPTIGAFFPSAGSLPTLLVDAGANVDSKARFLYEFGIMGSIYAGQILGLRSPKIGLLNVGEESSKGNEASKEAHKLLSESELNFMGNVEGRDILKGTANVIVCDGFTGNIVLKFAESFTGFLKTTFKAFASRSLFNKILIAMAMPALKKVFKDFDYQEYGGVPLLGVNGVSIIGHGKSTPIAFKNMLRIALEMHLTQVNKQIEKALATPEISKTN